MSKKYNPYEIEILMNQKYVQLSPEDLDSLIKGEATIKVQYAADKALEKYGQWMNSPLKRAEAFQQFPSNDRYLREVGGINNRLIFLQKTLINLGLVTQEQIDHNSHEAIAETWTHLCNDCVNTYPECKAEKRRLGIDEFPDLTGELADKVIECDKFEKPKIEGNA